MHVVQCGLQPDSAKKTAFPKFSMTLLPPSEMEKHSWMEERLIGKYG